MREPKSAHLLLVEGLINELGLSAELRSALASLSVEVAHNHSRQKRGDDVDDGDDHNDNRDRGAHSVHQRRRRKQPAVVADEEESV